VVPGFVDTELTRKNLAAYEIRALQQRIPLGRIADIDEVARFVLDLCEKNTYMNGQPLIMDGGLMAGGFWND
jgi:NAD(P)-dependent dehydrogenase (short-subunit alcohol dehydrogenase family)